MSFTQGVSGLQAAAADLDNIGNNIANTETIGFKSSRTQFADIYASARTGLGVSVSGTQQDFSTGSLENTGRDLDVAIDGNGFFRLTQDGTVQYSRDGQFQQTSDGHIANASGALLTGYNVSNFNNPNVAASVNAGGTPQPIQLPNTGLNARATTQASLPASLDASAVIKPGAVFDPTDPSTYDWSTPNTVYDSLGNAHSLQMYFTKTGNNQWRVNGNMALGNDATYSNTITANGNYPSGFDAQKGNGTQNLTVNGLSYTAKVTGASQDANGNYSGGTITYSEQIPATTLDFDTSGNLTSATTANKSSALPASQVAYALNAQNGSAPINFDFDFAGTSQTAQSFSAGNTSQDGYASGALQNITIGDDGTVEGHYDNGQNVNLAQLALAGFQNVNGLAPISGNAWTQTSASGAPALGVAGTGQFGSLADGKLEKSNVDLSTQLVDMIVSQRDYQANAQSIKTENQILQTVVNLS